MPDPTPPPRTFAGLTLEELEKLHQGFADAANGGEPLPTDDAVLELIDAYRIVCAQLELVRAGKGGGL